MSDERALLDAGRPRPLPRPAAREAARRAVLATLTPPRRRRASILVARAVTGLAVLTLVILVGSLLAAGLRGREAASPPAPTRYVDGQDGVSTVLPAGWSVASERVTRAEGARELFAAGTGPMPPTWGQCPDQPAGAYRAASPAGAFILLEEAGLPDVDLRTPARPGRFDLSAGSVARDTPCVGTAVVDVWRVPFQDRGRYLLLVVAVGQRATADVRAEAQRVADSIRVQSGRTWATTSARVRTPLGWGGEGALEQVTLWRGLRRTPVAPAGRDTWRAGWLAPGSVAVRVVELRGAGAPAPGDPIRWPRSAGGGMYRPGQILFLQTFRQVGPGRQVMVEAALSVPRVRGRAITHGADLRPQIREVNRVLSTVVMS